MVRRTLSLTDEQIQLVIQALGMAERTFTQIHQTIISESVNVRGMRGHNPNHKEQTEHSMYYHDMASKMADIGIDLRNGEFDV